MNNNLFLFFYLFFFIYNNFSVSSKEQDQFIELKDLNIKESLLENNLIKSMDLNEEFINFIKELKYLKLNQNFDINIYDNNYNLKKNDSEIYEEINHLKKSKQEDFKIFFFRILKCYSSIIEYIKKCRIEYKKRDNNKDYKINIRFFDKNDFFIMSDLTREKFKKLNNKLSIIKKDSTIYLNNKNIDYKKSKVIEADKNKFNEIYINYIIFLKNIRNDFLKIFDKAIFYLDYMISNSSLKNEKDYIYNNISKERLERLSIIKENIIKEKEDFYIFIYDRGLNFFTFSDFLENIDEKDNDIKYFLYENFFKSKNILKFYNINK